MALAITEMEALCQFRDPAGAPLPPFAYPGRREQSGCRACELCFGLSEISEFLKSEPEFACMCGEAEVAAFEAGMLPAVCR